MNKKISAHFKHAYELRSGVVCKLGKQLGTGEYGRTYACTSNTTRVVKCVRCPSNTKKTGRTKWRQAMRKEIEIQQEAAKLGIAPQIHSVDSEPKQTPNKFRIEMDRCSAPVYNSESAKQLVKSIAVMIDGGIVHNDLHQGNIMTLQGELKIIDYGFAKAIQKPTIDESNLLQAMHLAQLLEPEQVDNETNYTTREDKGFKQFISVLENRFFEIMRGYSALLKGLRASCNKGIANTVDNHFNRSSVYVKLQCFAAVHAYLSKLYYSINTDADIFWSIRQLVHHDRTCESSLWRSLKTGGVLSGACISL